MNRRLSTFITIILLSTFNFQLSTTLTAGEITFRGAWIATVANIDWPTPQAVGNDSLQQAEMTSLLDSLHAIGINAVIFQVRPTADALYMSELEPSSHWLTGGQGREMNYDPLEWMVKECHKRGMELHAWLNPYRVNIANMDLSLLTYSHLIHQHPEWFWRYGVQWYFNPALEQTRDWLCMVVDDIVCRYNIDAIHMDDYFYPYPISGKSLPDADDFRRHPRGFSNIGDWRRDNVNRTVQTLSETIHRAKPNVRFGISPFGIYKSDGSILSNYSDLYADVLHWIEQGWIDYVTPQLYWAIGSGKTDYAALAQWWATAVDSCNHRFTDSPVHRCSLYIGLAPYRVGSHTGAWSQGNEIVRQMRLNRTIEGITGECFYSTRPLLKNPRHVCDSIKAIYNE